MTRIKIRILKVSSFKEKKSECLLKQLFKSLNENSLPLSALLASFVIKFIYESIILAAAKVTFCSLTSTYETVESTRISMLSPDYRSLLLNFTWF